MKVLVVGQGGREHAICWKIAQSPLLTKLWCAPGNPGIAEHAELIDIKVDEIEALVQFAVSNEIDLVIPGPETTLLSGLVDALASRSIPCCGPTRNAAMLEGSKSFMKCVCDQEAIPTAKAYSFSSATHAMKYIDDRGHGYPVVVKADGLASGKGVIIAHSREEAFIAIEQFLQQYKCVVIEEFLEGVEMSYFALCDNMNAIPFGTAQDFKKAYDHDEGPNTGGMGAISPAPGLGQTSAVIWETIIAPTLQVMRARGTPFKGILYAGLMLTEAGPKLLEYNVRFGDPEAQALLRRLDSDLLDMLYRAATDTLEGEALWSDQSACSVVLASPGYPESPQMGSEIRSSKLEAGTAIVFHSGTAMAENKLIAIGGRVLTVSATGKDLDIASHTAYQAVAEIDWPEGWYRHDICG